MHVPGNKSMGEGYTIQRMGFVMGLDKAIAYTHGVYLYYRASKLMICKAFLLSISSSRFSIQYKTATTIPSIHAAAIRRANTHGT